MMTGALNQHNERLEGDETVNPVALQSQSPRTDVEAYPRYVLQGQQALPWPAMQSIATVSNWQAALA